MSQQKKCSLNCCLLREVFWGGVYRVLECQCWKEPVLLFTWEELMIRVNSLTQDPHANLGQNAIAGPSCHSAPLQRTLWPPAADSFRALQSLSPFLPDTVQATYRSPDSAGVLQVGRGLKKATHRKCHKMFFYLWRSISL